MRDAQTVQREWRVLIGGRPVEGSAMYSIEDPSTGRHLVDAPDCTPAEVDRAVAAARSAQMRWGATPPRARARLVRELAALVRTHREELALIDAVDGGFPYAAMLADVDAAADIMELFADMALELGGRTIPLSNNLHFTTRQPYGVVARVGAFNHPFFFAASKIAAPLVAGNAVVLKAPDQAPLSSLRLAELAAEVLPTDLVVTVSGRGAVAGRALVRHPDVPRIGFIGSPQTGRGIQRDAAEVGVKTVSLELGGKNAQIVMPDADPEAAAAAAVLGMNFTVTAGQSCGSTSRLLVHEDLVEEVTGLVAGRVSAIRVGHPLDDDTQMGPLASRAQYERSMHAIASARSAGAEVVAGGGRPDNLGDEGWYVAPTVIAGVDPGSELGTEEVFGPVLSIMTFAHEQEAVRIANSVEYGLTASVWTNDVSTALRLAAAVDAGYVLVNSPSRHFSGLPFGGVKASGVGREESLEELLSYAQLKATTVVFP